MICPLLSINFFSIPKIFRKTEGFLYTAFRFGPVRPKISTKPWCPLLCMKIFHKRIFLKQQSVLQWNILVQWDKNFSTENRDTSPPPSYPYFFPYQSFFETQYGSLAKFFWTCEIKKNFDKTVKLPPPFLENFRYQNSFETQKCSPTNFIGTVRQNFPTEFSDIPFLCINFCDTRNFLKHRSVPQRDFLVLCDKKFPTAKRDTPPLWCIKIFDTRIFLIHPNVPERNFSVLWDKKIWTKSRDT